MVREVRLTGFDPRHPWLVTHRGLFDDEDDLLGDLDPFKPVAKKRRRRPADPTGSAPPERSLRRPPNDGR